MTWPQTDVNTSNTDLGTDNPQLARADILDLMTKFNQLRVAAQLPIGSLYMNGSAATNPSTLLGYGTWASFGAGRVPVGIDPANPLMDAPGELLGSADAVNVSHDHPFAGTNANTGTESANHSHAVSDPGHSHGIIFGANDSVPGPYLQPTINFLSSQTTASATTGIYLGIESASHSHNYTPSGTVSAAGVTGTNANYQPSIAVYIWMRTA